MYGMGNRFFCLADLSDGLLGETKHSDNLTLPFTLFEAQWQFDPSL
jgi:hypothetical protein